MIHLLFLLLPLSSVSGREQLHSDSVLIYKTYMNEIAFLETVSEFDAWYERENRDDSLTACAFKRLKEYNGLRYFPLRSHNREGYGVAYEYPDPDKPEALAVISGGAEIKFSIL